MKKFTAASMISLSLAFLSGAAFASTPTEVAIPVEHIFAPSGFDTNDNTEIVVNGFLPNLCHKSPKTTVKIDGKKIQIKLTSLKYHSTNPYCPQVIVPIVETVDLGILDKGRYDITVNGKTFYSKKSSIEITEASSNAIDDAVYAGVYFVEKEENSRNIKLKGYNPSSCFVLEKIETFSNNKDTLSVLPKMKQISNFCPRKMVPFTYEMEVPEGLSERMILLHIRSMSGNSVNSLFKNK